LGEGVKMSWRDILKMANPFGGGWPSLIETEYNELDERGKKLYHGAMVYHNRLKMERAKEAGMEEIAIKRRKIMNAHLRAAGQPGEPPFDYRKVPDLKRKQGDATSNKKLVDKKRRITNKRRKLAYRKVAAEKLREEKKVMYRKRKEERVAGYQKKLRSDTAKLREKRLKESLALKPSPTHKRIFNIIEYLEKNNLHVSIESVGKEISDDGFMSVAEKEAYYKIRGEER